MARIDHRVHGPTVQRALALALAPALAGCASYAPAPIDVSGLLEGLEERRWDAGAGGGPLEAEAGGAHPAQLAAFAVAHHPALVALRERVGVARAELVEAGLLDDPELGWDGMDVLASQLVEGTSSSVDVVAGLGLSIPLPRPGERGAQEGAARWRVEEARLAAVAAEWRLARDVHVACEDVREAERLLAQHAELLAVVDTTRGYFERALAVGAATAIQAQLAAGEVLAVRADGLALEARRRAARQRLNALLGLPPAAAVPLAADPVDADVGAADAAALAAAAVERRPDLAALLAAYRAAEEELRLQHARQLPELSIGTGLWLVPGLFTRFQRPAIETAAARRAALAREVEARVHEVRDEVHEAVASYDEQARALRFLEEELLPNAEESLRLARAAFDAGEVTLLEILTLQRTLVDARTRTTEARAELRRQRWRRLAATGELFPPHDETDGGTDR